MNKTYWYEKNNGVWLLKCGKKVLEKYKTKKEANEALNKILESIMIY